MGKNIFVIFPEYSFTNNVLSSTRLILDSSKNNLDYSNQFPADHEYFSHPVSHLMDSITLCEIEFDL